MESGGRNVRQQGKDLGTSLGPAKTLWVCTTGMLEWLMYIEHFPITELQYKTSVIPTSIHIYETYHPGAVVKVLACNADPKEMTIKRSGEVEYVLNIV